jgi:glycerol kinase
VVRSENGLLSTLAYRIGSQPPAYALEGSVAIAGAAVQWLRDNLGLIQRSSDTEAIARSVEDAGGAYFVPAFSGLFAPYWDATARGAIVGLTRYVTRAHLVRATLEAICYQTRDVLDAMVADMRMTGDREQGAGSSRQPSTSILHFPISNLQSPISNLKVDGGATVNDFLMQLQADVLGLPVVRPTVHETTALGAAYAAGLAVGVWSGTEELKRHWRADHEFAPAWSVERRDAAYRGWQKAVARARDWVG